MDFGARDAIQPDQIECMLFALHRAGHLDRRQLVHLQSLTEKAASISGCF